MQHSKKREEKKGEKKGTGELVIALAGDTRQTSHSRASVIADSSKVVKRWTAIFDRASTALHCCSPFLPWKQYFLHIIRD